MQFTIAQPISISGIGLHTGNRTKLTFVPSETESGIFFRRVDLNGSPIIPARIENVQEVLRGTTLSSGSIKVHTVEHVMSAIYSMNIDNLCIDLEGDEPPACDGSAKPFVEALSKVGKIPQPSFASKEALFINESFWIEEGDRFLGYLPSKNFEITFTLEYPTASIPKQTLHVDINEDIFYNQISQARTFGFVHEFEMLKSKRLALGGSLENAVVIRSDGTLMNPDGVRHKNEFLFHKILDLVGDLALLGHPIKGHIIAHKTGHSFNVRLAQKIWDFHKRKKERKGQNMMNIDQIREILPHRYPFLLVDKILALEPGKSAIGIKNVTVNEEFFNGHFPQRPIMPGVLIVEAMAQVAGVLFLSQPEHKGKLPFFVGIDKIRFRKPVIPGDRVEITATALKVRGNTGKVAVEAKVEGETVTSGELMFTIV